MGWDGMGQGGGSLFARMRGSRCCEGGECFQSEKWKEEEGEEPEEITPLSHVTVNETL